MENLPTAEVSALVGELEPGDLGYVPLDLEGKPSGPAVVTPPVEDDTPHAPVYAQIVAPSEELSTPAGAPITNQMNPAHNFADKGLTERNPPGPALTKEQKDALNYRSGGFGQIAANPEDLAKRQESGQAAQKRAAEARAKAEEETRITREKEEERRKAQLEEAQKAGQVKK
jgi:hypothetical protein